MGLAAPNMFDKKHHYSRTEIKEILGGETQSVLPSKNGKIVAGCFSRDLNPAAPEVIYPGVGPSIVSRVMLAVVQGTSLPLFLRNEDDTFEFVGYYRPEKFVQSREEVMGAMASAGRDDISGLLHFAPAEAA